MQNPELFACLSKERKENLLENLLFRPSIYERLYYEEEMVRKQIVCYEEFLQIVRNPQIRAAAPEIDFEFEEFSANSYLSLVDEYLYWNKVPGDILLRLKKAAEDALAYARENKNFRQNEETLLGTLHTIQGYLGEISISEMLDTYVNWLNGADPTQYDWMNVENNLLPVLYTFWLCEARPEWTDTCRLFLLEGQRKSFEYIKNSRDKGAYECMQRFTSYIMNSYLSLVDEYLYWNKVPGDILLRLKKAAEDALAYARENKNFRQNEETLLGTLHTIQGYLGEISISEMLDAYVNGCETMEGVHASIDKTREFLFYCGMFHDAGKLYFLDTINLFARSLFNEEFDLIRPPRCATDSVGRAYSSSKNFADMLADLRCNAGRMFNPDLVQLFVSKISCRLLTSRIIRLCESRDCCTCLHGLIRNIAHGANTS